MADFDLTGQVALVTGASGDLGRHFAAVLAGAGAAIVLMARRGDVIAAEAERLRGLGHRAASVTGDITQAQGFNSAFAAAESELGPISLLVNNAGISLTTPSLDLADSDWDAVIDTNLKGAWLASHEAAQRWVKHKRPGNIINIASILGQRVANQTLPYAVSKAGLIQMTKALSLEWARHNIRVNALSPGYIRTALNEKWCRLHARFPPVVALGYTDTQLVVGEQARVLDSRHSRRINGLRQRGESCPGHEGRRFFENRLEQKLGLFKGKRVKGASGGVRPEHDDSPVIDLNCEYHRGSPLVDPECMKPSHRLSGDAIRTRPLGDRHLDRRATELGTPGIHLTGLKAFRAALRERPLDLLFRSEIQPQRPTPLICPPLQLRQSIRSWQSV